MGTWTVPSGLSPRADTATVTSIDGILSATGADRATTGGATCCFVRAATCCFVRAINQPGASAAPPEEEGGTNCGATGPGSPSWWTRKPTVKHPTAASNSTTATTHQRLEGRLLLLACAARVIHPCPPARRSPDADEWPATSLHLRRPVRARRGQPTRRCHRSGKPRPHQYAERPRG